MDGSRRYGFCNRSRSNTKRKLTPSDEENEHCFCIISQYPWFSFFSTILVITKARRNLAGEKSVTTFLDALLKHPFPFPGERFAIRCPTYSQTLDGTHYLTRPDDDHIPLADVKLDPLFSRFDLNQIMVLFACALQERRFIFVGYDINLISACTHALSALIYPLSWQHIFVPVLPQKLLNYVCAPMPFIVGIHTSMMKEVKQLPTEQIVIVDLNNGIIEGADNLMPLPNLQRLQSSVQKIVEPFSDREIDSVAQEKILDCFVDFFVDIFGEYRLFIYSDDGIKYKFDEDRFIQSKNEVGQVFIQHVRQCQHYQQFIVERLELAKGKGLPPGTFETKCSKIVPQAYGIIGQGKKTASSSKGVTGLKNFAVSLFKGVGIIPPSNTSASTSASSSISSSTPKASAGSGRPLPVTTTTTAKKPTTPSGIATSTPSVRSNSLIVAPPPGTLSDFSTVSNLISNSKSPRKAQDGIILDMSTPTPEQEDLIGFNDLNKMLAPPEGIVPKTPQKVDLKRMSSELDDFFAGESKELSTPSDVEFSTEESKPGSYDPLAVLDKLNALESSLTQTSPVDNKKELLDFSDPAPATTKARLNIDDLFQTEQATAPAPAKKQEDFLNDIFG